MNQQNNHGIETGRISVKDRDLIISQVETLGNIHLREAINRFSLGLRAYVTLEDPNIRGNELDIRSDRHDELR